MSITCERYLVASARREALERDVRSGLASAPKSLPPVWFYDERGSSLFETITELPEYYLTRAERSILSTYGHQIVERAGCSTLVELGSGSSQKTRLLLDAMAAQGLDHFVALDVSEEILVGSAKKVHADYGVDVTAIVGDFHRHLGMLPAGGRRLVAFLGSTIGNFEPTLRRRFFHNVAATMAPGDRFLLGADLRKDPDRLIRAYDDAAGVTAEFNRNVLRVLNHELGADFAPERFEHVCVWDDSASRIEMRLRAVQPERITIPAIGMEVTFAAGEELLTEISAKFAPEQVISELGNCGLATQGTWTDEAGDFMLALARPLPRA
jgi:L-histidine Nalpha-methyltransferase